MVQHNDFVVGVDGRVTDCLRVTFYTMINSQTRCRQAYICNSKQDVTDVAELVNWV